MSAEPLPARSGPSDLASEIEGLYGVIDGYPVDQQETLKAKAASRLAQLRDGFSNQDQMGENEPVLARPLSEFMKVKYPAIEELIPGLLARGAHTLASAKRGLGKSNLATTIGVSLAAGTSTLPGFEVTRPHPVLYLDGEMVPGLVQDRFKLHLAMLGIEPRDISDHLRVVSRIAVQVETGQRLPSLATDAGREWLLRELDTFPATVIFVDTVRALMRHPEHSMNDEEGWRPCEELLAELSGRGVACFYIHHDGKGGDQLGTVAREFDPSYVLHMTPPKRPGVGLCRFRLQETKGRMGPTFAPREYVLGPGQEGVVEWTIVEEEARTKAEKILEHSTRDPSASAATIAKAVGTTDSHVRSTLSKARRSTE